MKKLISSLAVTTLILGVTSCAKVEEEAKSAIAGSSEDYTEYNAAPSGSAGNLTGTAAIGAPIPNGIVKILCDDQALPEAATDAFGKWSVDVSGCSAPYLVRIKGSVGGKDVDLLSAADAEDVGEIVNVTPLTHMIVANMIQDVADAETLFTKFEDATFDIGAKISKTKINAQETKIKTALADVIKAATGKSDISDIDLMNMPFATDHSGMDAVLDVIKVEENAGSFEVKLADASGTALFTDDPAADDAPATAVSVTASDITEIVETYQGVDSVLRDLIKYVQSNAAAINAAHTKTQLPTGYASVFHSDFLDRGSDPLGALHQWFGLDDMADYQKHLGSSQADFANANISKDKDDDSLGILFFDFIIDGKIQDKGISLQVAKEGGSWKLLGDQIPFEFRASIAISREYGVTEDENYNINGGEKVDSIKLELGFDDGAVVGDVTQVRISNSTGAVIAEEDMSFEDWDNDGSQAPYVDEHNSGEPDTISNGVMENGSWRDIVLDAGALAKFTEGDLGEYKLEFLDANGSLVGSAVKVLLADPNLMSHDNIPAMKFNVGSGDVDLSAANMVSFCDNASTSFEIIPVKSDLNMNHFWGSISDGMHGEHQDEVRFEDDDSDADSQPLVIDASSAGLQASAMTYKQFGLYLRSSSEVEYSIKARCY